MATLKKETLQPLKGTLFFFLAFFFLSWPIFFFWCPSGGGGGARTKLEAIKSTMLEFDLQYSLLVKYSFP